MHSKKKYLLAMGLGIASLFGSYFIFISPAADPFVGVYDDFFGQEHRSGVPLILDIQVGELEEKYEQKFQLPLRRDYSLTLALIVEDGINIDDPDTHISGNIEIRSSSDKILLKTSISLDYKLEWAPEKLLTFSFRDVGKLNSEATLLITDLKIEKSIAVLSGKAENLEMYTDLNSKPTTLETLKLRFIIRHDHGYFR